MSAALVMTEKGENDGTHSAVPSRLSGDLSWQDLSW